MYLENNSLCHLNEGITKTLPFKTAASRCRRTDVACRLAIHELKSDVNVCVRCLIGRAYVRRLISGKNDAYQVSLEKTQSNIVEKNRSGIER